MTEDLFKSKLYASAIDDRLKHKRSINLSELDYTSFLSQATVTENDDNHVVKILDPFAAKTISDVSKEIPTIRDILLAEEKAALSGKFNPEDILPQNIPPGKKRKILSSLSRSCIIDTTTETRWHLSRRKREQVLGRLIKTEVLQNKLSAQLPHTDDFGMMLRRVLKEQAGFSAGGLTQPELITLSNVLETLYDVPVLKPNVNEVKAKITMPGILDEYSKVASEFMGHEPELKKLHTFLTADHADWRGLVISGMGGIGKSTLIARFMEDVLSRNIAAVSLLDFDRPGITPKDVFWLAQEITRQLAQQFADIKDDIIDLRSKVREEKNALDSKREPISENDPSSDLVYSMIIKTRDALIKTGHEKKPFLLIFDTMEEVLQNGDSDKLIEWINKLAHILPPLKIRIIFCGRLFGKQLQLFTKTSQVENEVMCLDEFDTSTAAAFLIKLGLKASTAGKIIDSGLFPLRPLDLKLLARLLKDKEVTFPDISKELRSDKIKHSKDLFTGIIYRRVLMRISDKRVRDIAYPGLVLRYITPDILMNVLQPTLNLKQQMTAKDVEEIMAALENLSWLSYTTNGQVWHRKDLRRSTLKLMTAQDAEKVRNVRKVAIEYFEQKNTPEDQAESIYHRLMNVTKKKDLLAFQPEALKNAFPYISQDIKDLPRAAAAFLKHSTGQQVNNDELHMLPNPSMEKGYYKVGRQLVIERKFTQASDLYKEHMEMQALKDVPQDDLFDNWELDALFCVADWEAVKNGSRFTSTGTNTSLISVLNYIYPMALLAPRLIKPALLERLLCNSTRNTTPFGTVTQKTELAMLLSRSSICLAILHGSGRLTKNAKEHIRALIQLFSRAELSPSQQKSLSLLNMICYKRPQEFHLPGGSLLRLDKKWLMGLQPLIQKEYYPLLQRTVELFEEAEKRNPTARDFLGHFDSFARDRKMWPNVKIKLTHRKRMHVYELFKGPEAMFRDPCRYALLDAFKSRADIKALVDIMNKVISMPLSDLTEKALGTMLKDNREFALEPFIEIIDRSWKMGTFLRLVHKAKPASKKISDIVVAHTMWQRMLKKLVTNK